MTCGNTRYRFPFPRVFYRDRDIPRPTVDAIRSIARALEQIHVGIISTDIVDNCPDSITVNTGTLSAGAVGDLQETGGTTVNISEAASTPGFDVEFAFSGLGHLYGYSVKAYYSGSASHEVHLEIYNYSTTNWDVLDVAAHATQGLWHWYSGNIRETDYISDGAAKLRFYHYSAGNAAHDLYLDFVSILGFGETDA